MRVPSFTPPTTRRSLLGTALLRNESSPGSTPGIGSMRSPSPGCEGRVTRPALDAGRGRSSRPTRTRQREGGGVGDVPREVMWHCGRSGISRASYARRRGFDSRSRYAWAGGANRQRSSLARRRLRVRIPRGPPTNHHADVAQRQRHGAQNAVSAGSNPAVSTDARWWKWNHAWL